MPRVKIIGFLDVGPDELDENGRLKVEILDLITGITNDGHDKLFLLDLEDVYSEPASESAPKE